MSYTPPIEAEVTAFVTTTPLGAGATFDSGVLDAAGKSQVQTEINASHDGNIDIEFCADAGGTDVVRSLSIPYVAANGYQFFAAPAFVNYIRYQFTNTAGVVQTDFYYTTKFLTTGLSPQLLTTNAFIADAMVAHLGRNLLVGQNDGGQFKNVRIDNQQHLEVNASNPKTSFDEIPVAQLSPVNQITFPYTASYVNSDIIDDSMVLMNGSVSVSNNMALISTGALAGGQQVIQSIKKIPFRAGQGHLFRSACKFDTKVDNLTARQWVGVGDINNGFLFGYSYDNISGDLTSKFGITYRQDTAATVVFQEDWNIDKMDGTGPSGVTLDPEKGNTYQISYGSGFGNVNYSIESPLTGDMVLVHTLTLANSLTEPSTFLPTFPMCAEAHNGTAAIDCVLSIASMSSFIEGINAIESQAGVINSIGGSVLSTIGVAPVGNDQFQEETQIITYYNKEDVFGGTANNRVSCKILGFNIINDTNKTAIVRLREDAVGIGLGVPTDINTTSSVMAYNIGQAMLAGGIVSGKVLFEQFAEKDGKGGGFVNISDLNLTMTPGKSYTMSIATSAAAAGAGIALASMLWTEDF